LLDQALPTTIKKELRTSQFDRDIKSPFATPKARPMMPNSALKVSTKKVVIRNTEITIEANNNEYNGHSFCARST
jgi:hypothetical protein